MFLFAHEQIDTGGPFLVPMEVPRIWWTCVFMKLKMLFLKMKSKIARTIWVGGRFVCRRCWYFSIKLMAADILSSYGMFLYREVTRLGVVEDSQLD